MLRFLRPCRRGADDEPLPATVTRLLAPHKALLAHTQTVLGLADDDYVALITPLVRGWAGYCLHLPASQHHHHREPGGLLRHGLEAAYWAAQATDDRLLHRDAASPSQRYRQEPRWRLATYVAALLHDVGRPVTDLTVYDADAPQCRWDPERQRQDQWAAANRVRRPTWRWHQERRYTDHDAHALPIADRLIPHGLTDWLREHCPEAVTELRQTLANRHTDKPLPELVVFGDRASVHNDIKARGQDPNVEGVRGLDELIVEAMQSFLKEGYWRVNTEGARVWATAEDAWVVTPVGIEDIIARLHRHAVRRLPGHPQTVVQEMVNYGIVRPYPLDDGTHRNVLRIKPERLPTSLWAVRVALHHLWPEPADAPEAAAVAVQPMEESSPSPAPTAEQGAARPTTSSPGGTPSPRAASPATALDTTPPTPATPTLEAARAALEAEAERLGAHLVDVAARRLDGDFPERAPIDRQSGRLILRWPEGAYQPRLACKTALESLGWVEADPDTGGSLRRDASDQQYLVLAGTPHAVLAPLLPEGEASSADTATDARDVAERILDDYQQGNRVADERNGSACRLRLETVRELAGAHGLSRNELQAALLNAGARHDERGNLCLPGPPTTDATDDG